MTPVTHASDIISFHRSTKDKKFMYFSQVFIIVIHIEER